MSLTPKCFPVLFATFVGTACLYADVAIAQLRAGVAARREAREERWNQNRSSAAELRPPAPTPLQNASLPPRPLGQASLEPRTANNLLSRQPISMTVPANSLPYTGSGVTIRMPSQLQGEVQFLIDNSQRLVVHSGEQQQLRSKPQYEVRFSRGVQKNGQSFGEARYTLTEGTYRFDTSDKGWELYRETDASKFAAPKNLAPVKPELAKSEAPKSGPIAAKPNLAPSLEATSDALSPIGTGSGNIELGEPNSSAKPETRSAPESLPVPKSQSILEP